MPMKMEPTEGYETSAIRNKAPGNYPKENIPAGLLFRHHILEFLKVFLLYFPMCPNFHTIEIYALSVAFCFVLFCFSRSHKLTLDEGLMPVVRCH